MKKLLLTLLVLAILGGGGFAGWWYAADRGLIAGKPNSPRAENFKAAIDHHLAQGARNFYSQPCVSVPVPPGTQGGGFKDTRFDHTPVGFFVSPDLRNDPGGSIKNRLAFLEKQGLLQSSITAGGSTEFVMTWRGFAASNGNGCFHVSSAERDAKIIGFEKKRSENGVDIYEVTASAQPKSIEAWAQTPEFKDLFPQQSGMLRQLNPDPVIYELARGDTGFTVITERGQPTRSPASEQAAITVKLVGKLTADRVKAAAQSYIARTSEHVANNRLCLQLPGAHEVDQITPDPRVTASTAAATDLSFDIYNLINRELRDGDPRLRSYAFLRRLETLGIARSELLNYSEFNGAPAQGGVRFVLPRSFTERFAGGPRGCYVLGTLQVEEAIRFMPFSTGQPNPPFTARLALTPVDEDAKRIIAAFGHYSRVAEAGAVLSGTLNYKDGELQVGHAQLRLPTFHPDVSGLRLPVIQTGLSRPPGAAPLGARGFISVPNAQSGSLTGTAVHAIGVYEGRLPGGLRREAGSHPEGVVNVTVHPTRDPAVLYLVAYEPVNWVLQVRPGARLTRIITSGYHAQRVTVQGAAGVPVVTTPYRGEHSDPFNGALRVTGVKPASAQHQYSGASFEVGR
ncbi:MAG: hypothetical protein K2W84_07015 [Burkholderiales bacterium]|nr:hypothetical protein [Burkholderiales bacterium]